MAKTFERTPSTKIGAYPPAVDLYVQRPKPNGVAAAAILAAAISTLVLGLMTVTTEAIPAWNSAVTFVNAVGPLSGQTDIMVAAYVLALAILTALWRKKNVNFAQVWIASIVLLALGLLGSFPPIYHLFTAR